MKLVRAVFGTWTEMESLVSMRVLELTKGDEEL